MKKTYEAPCFEEIKYNDFDILTASDNILVDATDPNGLGGMTDIDD